MILRNWAVDCARQHVPEVPVMVLPDVPADIDDAHVHDALEVLAADPATTDRDRAVFRAYYVDGFLLREIADRWGVSEARACRVVQAVTERAAELLRRADR